MEALTEAVASQHAREWQPGTEVAIALVREHDARSAAAAHRRLEMLALTAQRSGGWRGLRPPRQDRAVQLEPVAQREPAEHVRVPVEAPVSATVAAVRSTLAAVPGFTGFSELPAVRAAGDWPGKSAFDQFSKFFYVISVLALLAALVLISNTMTTLVGEQTSEIGIMKAVGGRRRQVAAVYLKTALFARRAARPPRVVYHPSRVRIARAEVHH